MKIDLPIVIMYDCQDVFSSARQAVNVVCTLRYETGGDGSDALLFQGYPMEENDKRVGEPAQALLAYLPSASDKKITAKALRNPYDYLTGEFSEAERTMAQEEVDEELRQGGQFGAGA